jgi:hypothetical protein
MAGFNPTALKYSQAHLDSQVQAIYDTLPHIIDVTLSKASSGDPNAVDLFSDYILGIDGHAYDMRGKDYTVSFKSRFESKYPQDLRLEAIKLTDVASHSNNLTGFIYKGERYAFDGYADINVQFVDGRNYVFLASEVETLALHFGSAENELIKDVYQKNSKDRNGEDFFSGKYYVFIDKERFCNCITWHCQRRVNYQKPESETDAET